MNIFDLTPHQLDVIRTGASVIGAIGGFIGGVGGVAAFLARYWAKMAAHNTSASQWVNGEHRATPVVEYVRHAATATEATRQEVSDFYQEWVKGTGRRRLPTTEIPPISQERTHYE